jgi:hypothetical protein
MTQSAIPLESIDRRQNHVLAGSKVRRHYLLHDSADEKRDAWAEPSRHLENILVETEQTASDTHERVHENMSA